MSLNTRIAVLTDDMVREKPWGYWSKETILKWLKDQGFDTNRDIGKARNWKDGRFVFTQSKN